MRRADKPQRNRQWKAVPAGRSIAGGRGEGSAPLVLWGVHPVLETLKVRPLQCKEIYLAQQHPGSRLQQVVELAEQNKIRISFSAEAFTGVLNRNDIAGHSHQGVLAFCEPFPTLTLADLTAEVEKIKEKGSKPPTLVVLDSIQDPQNVGAIMRSALAAGVHGILIAKDRAAPLHGTVAKASAGAIAHLRLYQVANLSSALLKIKELGYWVFGTIKDGSQSLFAADFSLPVCLVLGSEHSGMRPLVARQCDFLITIPMQGGLDSLNASTAAAIILFEMVRQRESDRA
jgi:23S rRNA (guanosine2251-2'-O)-methyltransferase